MRSINNFFKIIFFNFLILNFVFADPTISISPQNQTVAAGANAIVQIVTTNANKCTVSGDKYSGNNVTKNGKVLLNPTQNVTYTFTCTDTNGTSVNATTSVTVSGSTTTSGGNTSGNNNNNTSNNPGNTNTAQNTNSAQQYPTQTIQTEADAFCSNYTSAASVYGSAAPVNAGGTVPVNLIDLIPVLQSIQQNTQLTANEARDVNMLKYCREYQNMARASNKLAQDTAKELKKIADDCTADAPCYLKRTYDSDIQNAIQRAQQIPVVGRDIAQMLLNANKPVPDNISQIDFKQAQKCWNYWSQNQDPLECLGAPTKDDVRNIGYYDFRNPILARQGSLSAQFQANGGVIGKTVCIKTADGSDPSQVDPKDKNCVASKQQPAIITQETLRQITALPYTQAYSPSSVLGADQAIGNIDTRVRNGNLIDPNITNGFGSSAGNNSGNGTGGNIGGNSQGTDLSSVEQNYNKIITNIGVITTLYKVARAAYASSTSVCSLLPVQSRRTQIQNIDSSSKTYSDYANSLTAAWNTAKKTPNENHTDLLTKINLDLKDKYNQSEINNVYDAVKTLLQTCVDAKSGATTS